MPKNTYQSFSSASERHIILCGRAQQAMELLIEGRIQGHGTRRSGAGRVWNVADAVRKLALQGVSIGKRKTSFDDNHTFNGFGTTCDYFLLEDWHASGGLHNSLKDADEETLPVCSLDVPVTAPFDPFLSSGSIRHREHIVPLNTSQETSVWIIEMRRRCNSGQQSKGAA